MCEKAPLLLSACLAGVPCRFDGSHKVLPTEVLEKLLRENVVVLACPEICGDLPVPRDQISIVGGDGGDVLEGRARASTSSSQDVTQNLITGARCILSLCQKLGIKRAILKSKSPSCSVGFLLDRGQHLYRGDGVTAALLQANSIECKPSTDFTD